MVQQQCTVNTPQTLNFDLFPGQQYAVHYIILLLGDGSIPPSHASSLCTDCKHLIQCLRMTFFSVLKKIPKPIIYTKCQSVSYEFIFGLFSIYDGFIGTQPHWKGQGQVVFYVNIPGLTKNMEVVVKCYLVKEFSIIFTLLIN